jgi:hypothetical protein
MPGTDRSLAKEGLDERSFSTGDTSNDHGQLAQANTRFQPVQYDFSGPANACFMEHDHLFPSNTSCFK